MFTDHDLKIMQLEKENKRLRKELADPGMESIEYRTLLDLLMCSDPWPTETYEFDHVGLFTGEQTLKEFANRKARYCGYKDWIDAYHDFDPNNLRNESTTK